MALKDNIVPASADHRKQFNPEWQFLLYLDQVTAVFDGFKALDIESMGVYYNELRTIIGPNGAGKTTLCDVVTGKTRPTTGRVYVDGSDATRRDEAEIAALGVGRKFQTPTVFDSLTVYENAELALPGRMRIWPNLWRKESSAERDRILGLLERVHLLPEASQPARYLSHGQRQWLEICMLILSGPKLLLVDEPAAGLTDHETELTAELLLELQGEHSIIVIEHDMDFVRQLDARVTVLNEGQILAEGSMDEVQNNEQVIEAYLGR
jgi:urea transport system ATP-binding protein